MRKRLLLQALCKLFLSIAVTASLIFVSAGTLHYWNGWLFLCIWFVPMILLGTVLLIKKPELLKKRLSERETNKTQKLVRAFGVFMFLTGFLLAGLSCRFGWLRLPDWIAWTGSVLFLLSYLLCGEVLRENAYLSRTVEIQKDQKVIDTGLYGIPYVWCNDHDVSLHTSDSGFHSPFYCLSRISRPSGQTDPE